MFKAIGSFFGFAEKVTESIGSYDERAINKLKYRIESAMKYVFIDEGSGQYMNLSDKQKKKLKFHYRKRIFDV